MQPAGTSKHCPARKVTGVLSRVMVISPPRTNSLGVEVMAVIGATRFGFTLLFTTPIAVATQFRFEFGLVHCLYSLLG